MPLDQPFAVISLLNKQGAAAFEAEDERRLTTFAASISVVLETWHAASTVRRARAHDTGPAAREAVG